MSVCALVHNRVTSETPQPNKNGFRLILCVKLCENQFVCTTLWTYYLAQICTLLFFCCVLVYFHFFFCHLSCSDLLNIKLIWCSTHKSICSHFRNQHNTPKMAFVTSINKPTNRNENTTAIGFWCENLFGVCTRVRRALMYSFPAISQINNKIRFVAFIKII